MQFPQADAESAAGVAAAKKPAGASKTMDIRPNESERSEALRRNCGHLPEGLARALAWLNDHPDEPIRLEILAAVAGMRPRTLEAQFKLYLGAAPLRWTRRMRLARARQQLLAANGDVTITDVAIANGFDQLGRFAGHYRQQFGELPSQTLNVGRGPAGEPIEDEALRLGWHAVDAAFRVGPDACQSALENAERAQQLAPRFALPKAIAAWCLGQSAAHGFCDTERSAHAQSLQFSEQASSLAPHDALVLSLCSGALTLARKLDDADRMIERALAIDPWSPFAWVRRAWLSAYLGDPDGAIRELQITLRLMPFEPVRHLAFIGIGCAHFDAARYERAAQWVRAGIEAGPESYWAERVLVAALAHAEARSEARRSARKLLRRDPDLTVATAREAWPFRPSFMHRLADGLEAAGMPRA
jgi:AraC-like DNA-binding protein